MKDEESAWHYSRLEMRFFFIIVLCIRYLILEMARRLASKLPFGTFSEAEISLVREEQGLLVGYISECIFTT